MSWDVFQLKKWVERKYPPKKFNYRWNAIVNPEAEYIGALIYFGDGTVKECLIRKKKCTTEARRENK